MANDGKPTLTDPERALRDQVAPRTIREWAQRGRLGGERRGGRRYVPRSALKTARQLIQARRFMLGR